MFKYLLLVAFTILAACQSDNETPSAVESVADNDQEVSGGVDTGSKLAAILDAQPDDVKARYVFRNPPETIEFFGIEPGMTVLEGLPGGGWYTRLLAPALSRAGQLYVAFGGRLPEEVKSQPYMEKVI